MAAVAEDVEVRPAVPGDGHLIAALLQPDDRRECLAAAPGRDPGELFEENVARGETYLALRSGRPMALFGVLSRSPDGELAQLWLLGSLEIGANPRALLRAMRAWIPRLLRGATGWNLIDSRKAATVRVLRHLGAQFYRANRPIPGSPDAEWLLFHVEP